MGMMSAALFQGAGAGMNLMAGGMMKDIANKDEQEMWEKRSRLLAEIQRENAKVIGQDTIDRENDPGNVGKRAATAGTLATAAGATAREQAALTANDPALIRAEADRAARERGYRTEDAAAAAESARKATVAAAADPEFIKAKTAVALADPEVAARLAVAKAALTTAGANAGLARAQAEGVELTNKDKKALNGLYDEASKILSDGKIDDVERGKRFSDVEKQIRLIKSKNTTATRDPELDTETVTTEKENPDGTTTKVTRKEVRKPGGGGKADPVDPVKAAMDAKRAEDAKKTAKPTGGMINVPQVAPPQGDYAMFEAMDDDTLKRYAQAGNLLAIEVIRRRSAQPVQTRGETQGD